jgi:ParB-like chromosome segregation protein Spo0J
MPTAKAGSPAASGPTNQVIRLADFRPHPRNYNQHPAEQIDKLAASLAAFGQVRSVVVWRGWFLAGTGLALAAQRLGWAELRADVLPDDYPETKALAYLAADNELARQSDPDLAQLAAILEESAAADGALLLAIGYSDAEYDRMLGELAVTALSDATPAEGSGQSRGMTNDPTKQIKAVLYADDVADFERAILATGQRNRAAALLTVCRFYLDNHGESETEG